MTRILGAAVLLGTVLVIIYAAGVRPEREPLLIDAGAKAQAAPNLLFAPCPMAPQNIPPRIKETEA